MWMLFCSWRWLIIFTFVQFLSIIYHKDSVSHWRVAYHTECPVSIANIDTPDWIVPKLTGIQHSNDTVYESVKNAFLPNSRSSCTGMWTMNVTELWRRLISIYRTSICATLPRTYRFITLPCYSMPARRRGDLAEQWWHLEEPSWTLPHLSLWSMSYAKFNIVNFLKTALIVWFFAIQVYLSTL